MNEVKRFENPQIQIALATETDISEISRLQQENLARNVTAEEKEQQGFVSVETPPELLQEIVRQEGITVAKVDGKVVGYLMPLSVEHGRQISLLDPFIERFSYLNYADRPLNSYRYAILGQVCIAKEHRGKGILEKLYLEAKLRLALTLDILVTEVGANNPRSLHVHRDKLGLSVVDQYSAEGKDWYILILDLREKAS